MKKRDIFWLNRVLLIVIFGIIFVCVSLYNIIQFNNSYIQEERNELEIYKKQVEWVIEPLLKNNDLTSLKKYAQDFSDDKEFAFRIFDSEKNIIISSKETNTHNIQKNDNRMLKIQYNIWDLYIDSFKDKTLEKVDELNINGKKYYLEISLSEEFVISSIIRAQKNILIFFCICLTILFIGLIHIFHTIRTSFNSLEDSVMKIAEGDLDTEIALPKLNLLSELTVSIKKMTLKLKSQILRMVKLEKYRSDFITNVSHEIKTPITAINSAVELIESSNDISELNQECFNIIKTQTSSINRLVGDILELSEIDLEKTKEKTSFTTINLNRIIKECIDSQNITNQNIKFNTDKEYSINGNEELVKTAVLNLLTNAIKYSCSDRIDINLYKKENIILEITDYGIGIPKEHIPRIFERFYRVDKSRSRKNGGTGLGLAIVKNIVELHDWEIEVESEPDKGTTFRITII